MNKKNEELRRVNNLIENIQLELNNLGYDIKKIERADKEIEMNIRQTKKDYDRIRTEMEKLEEQKKENTGKLYEIKDQENNLKKSLNRLLIEAEQIKNQK
jgi:chromosome segregation ATPase